MAHLLTLKAYVFYGMCVRSFSDNFIVPDRYGTKQLI